MMCFAQQDDDKQRAQTRPHCDGGMKAERFTVVLVEDGREMRDVFCRVLERAGHPVRAFASGRCLLDELVNTADSVGAAFIDQQIDGEKYGGLGLLQEIKRRYPYIPVIMYTAATSDDCRMEAYEHGAFLYLFKPHADPQAIANLAEALVGLREAFARQREARFLQTIIDALDVEVFVRDEDRNILWVNQRKLDNLGIRREHLADKRCPVFEDLMKGAEYRHASAGCVGCPYDECFFGDHPTRDVVRWYRSFPERTEYDFLHLVGRLVDIDGRPCVVEQATRLSSIARALRLAAELQNNAYQNKEVFLKAFARELVSLGYQRCRVFLQPHYENGDFAMQFVYAIDAEGNGGPAGGEVRFAATERIRRIFDSGEPVIIRPSDISPDLDEATRTRLADVRELVCFVVRDGKRARGVFSLDHGPGPHHGDKGLIDPSDILTLGFLARVAEGNLRTLKEKRVLKALDQLDRSILAATKAADVLRAITDTATRILHADEAMILVPNYESGFFETVEFSGDGEFFTQTRDQPIAAGIAGRAVRDKTVIAISDVWSDPDFLELIGDDEKGNARNLCGFPPKDLKSALKGPVFSAKNPNVVEAVLTLRYKTHRDFDDDDIDLGQKLCARIGLAFDRFKRLNELETRTATADLSRTLAFLAEGLAHSYRTPLGILRNHIQLLAVEPGLPPAAAERLAKMRRELDQAFELIQNLRRFAGLEDGLISYDQGFDVAIIVTDFLSMSEEELKRKDIKVQFEKKPVSPSIYYNPAALRTCINNLLTNALEALSASSSSDRRLCIRMRCPDAQRLTLEVADNGVPFPAELKRYIFLPFWPTTKLGVGLGLGLAIAYQTAERIGGKLALREEPEGFKTFELSIPLSRRE